MDARVAELVDAQDLKSCFHCWKCRFDPGLGYESLANAKLFLFTIAMNDIVSILEKNMGKKQAFELVEECKLNPEILAFITNFGLKNQNKAGMHASWVLSTYAKKYKSFPEKELKLIVDTFSNPENDLKISRFLEIFSYAEFDMENNAQLIDTSIRIIQNKKTEGYQKYLALKLLKKFVKAYPALKKEIELIIDISKQNFDKGYLFTHSKDF